MSRITRDQMLMTMAHAAAMRGTCRRLSVGALLAMEFRPISVGYNGAASGMPHCGSDCCSEKPCLNTIHAEDNAIRWAKAFLGSNPLGATLYCTHSPCKSCAQKIRDAGIVRVVYGEEYRSKDGLLFLQDNDIEVDVCRVSLAINAN